MMAHASCGGSAKVAASLAAAMSARGHVVHLFTRTIPFSQRRDRPGVALHCLTPYETTQAGSLHTDWTEPEMTTFVSMVVDTVLEQRLELLHFHYAIPFAFLAHEVKLRLGRRAPALIGTLHGTDVSIQAGCAQTRRRLSDALQQVDALTTVSRHHAQLASSLMSLPVAPKVIPNFVDLQHPASARGGSARRRPRIGHISNFRAIKDPAGMAEIFLAVKERLDAELWLVGDGPMMPDVRSLLGVDQDGDVRYWGLQAVVEPLLAQIDMLLVTSRMESFCLVALEAMACGVPVLAPRVGGLPEVVADGQTGYLFTQGDHEQAVGLALVMLRDEVTRHRMARAARARARQFSPAHVVPLYEQVYGSALQARRVKHCS